ncbi:MAG: ABC transporter permease [Terracidiphilus sp.]
MRRFTNLVNGLMSLIHKQRVENELEEELRSYVEESVADKQGNGMTPEIARRTALAEVGSRNSVKHQVWSSRWESTLDGLLQDLRLSLRTLCKSPGFTVVALLSLALGIGGNTAIFTLMHQVMLRDLPVRDPQQLVTFDKSIGGGIIGGVDLGTYGLFPWSFAHKLEAAPGPFQGIASYSSFSPTVSVRRPSDAGAPGASTQAITVPATLVSGNYFSLLGAQPLMGRMIGPSDNATPESGAVAVISYRFWQQSLSADPAILGKVITINGTPFTVIGVMPPEFQGFKSEIEPAALWAPIMMQPVVYQDQSYLSSTFAPYFLHLFGRLSPQAVSNRDAFAQSQQWVNQQVQAGIRETEGNSITAARQQEISRVNVALFHAQQGVSQMRGQYGDSLSILMAVVVLVLLIACANLANFLLARGAARQRETATRLALGSSRGRIVRQSLIETLLLSITGGALGLLIAFVATRALIAFVTRGTSVTALSPTPDAAVLLFTIGVALATGLLFGLAPALAAARIGAATTLASNARTAQAGGGRSSRLWPKTLVIAQITLSLLLLVGAGLFLRSLRNLQNQDFGFERTHLLMASFDAQLAGYKTTQAAALDQQLIDRLSALPGVRSVAISGTAPISEGNWTSSIKLSGYTPAPKENLYSLLNRVSGKYFETAGIAIVAGRPITPADSVTSLKVAVISQSLASHFFPKGDAIGKMLTIDIDSVAGPWQIVGIARDSKSTDPRNTDPVRMTYIPLAQIAPFTAADQPASATAKPAPPEPNNNCFASNMILRTTGDPSHSIADLRAAVASIDPNLPLLNVVTIHDQVSSLMSHDELISALTGMFSVLALLLAAIGLYGVMSYNVVRRTNEIGIRFALGAQGRTVLWMILRESLLLLSIGLVLGLPLAVTAARYIKLQLFDLNPMDLTTFVLAVTVVSAMTVFSAFLPARRAAKVDPMVAIRCD